MQKHEKRNKNTHIQLQMGEALAAPAAALAAAAAFSQRLKLTVFQTKHTNNKQQNQTNKQIN